MTPQQIKDNAPDGATHYHEIKNEYYKLHGRDLWRWIGKWLYLRNCDDGLKFISMLGIIKIKPL